VGKGPQGWAHPGLGHLALVVRRVLWSPAVRYTELLWEGEVGPRVTISLLRHLALKLIMSLIVQRDDAACREGSLGLKVVRTGRGQQVLSGAQQSQTVQNLLSFPLTPQGDLGKRGAGPKPACSHQLPCGHHGVNQAAQGLPRCAVFATAFLKSLPHTGPCTPKWPLRISTHECPSPPSKLRSSHLLQGSFSITPHYEAYVVSPCCVCCPGRPASGCHTAAIASWALKGQSICPPVGQG
jgi:hypothetical protein